MTIDLTSPSHRAPPPLNQFILADSELYLLSTTYLPGICNHLPGPNFVLSSPQLPLHTSQRMVGRSELLLNVITLYDLKWAMQNSITVAQKPNIRVANFFTCSRPHSNTANNFHHSKQFLSHQRKKNYTKFLHYLHFLQLEIQFTSLAHKTKIFVLQLLVHFQRSLDKKSNKHFQAQGAR